MNPPLHPLLPAAAHQTCFSTQISAPLASTWAAVLAVTPAELPVTRMLTRLRSTPARALGAEHTGPADAPDRPVVAQFVTAGFGVLVDDPPHVLVVGAAAQPWRLRSGARTTFASAQEFVAFDAPEYVRIALSFELAPDVRGGTRLAAETRVSPTDAAAARMFRRYWAAIWLGGAAIRLELLRAIGRRAEHSAACSHSHADSEAVCHPA